MLLRVFQQLLITLLKKKKKQVVPFVNLYFILFLIKRRKRSQLKPDDLGDAVLELTNKT